MEVIPLPVFGTHLGLAAAHTQLLSVSQWFLLYWRTAANGHISRRLVPLRRLGDAEVIPSSLLSSTPGIHHFISSVKEDGGGGAGGARGTSHTLISNSSSSQVSKVNNGLLGTNEAV